MISLGKRLASGLRRRAAYAWSRLTRGDRPPSAEAAAAWLSRRDPSITQENSRRLTAAGADRPFPLADADRRLLAAGYLHAMVEAIEQALAAGRRDEAAQLANRLQQRQRRDGSVPARPDAGWVCSEALARLTVCWYRLGRRGPADRAMRHLARRQNVSGGFYGSWGRGAARLPQEEIAATARAYLEAALLQVEAAFADVPTAALPDAIDLADGRVLAVREWMESLPADARVADVGCGSGRYLRHIATWFPLARLTGIDISPALLAQLPPHVTPLVGSLLRTGAADGSFDGVLAVESLEHALLPAQAVAELCRIVRPGGMVLVIDKHRVKQPLSEHQPWERWFTPAELTEWLSRACDKVRVQMIAHSEGRGGDDLFLAASGRRRDQPKSNPA